MIRLLSLKFNLTFLIQFKNLDALETSVAGLNSKIDVKVSGMDSKLDAIIQSLSETNKSGPTVAEREAHLDQFISLCLKNKIEEVEKKI